MAYDAMLDGKTGLMSALVKGCYELLPIPDPKLGPRKLDVATNLFESFTTASVQSSGALAGQSAAKQTMLVRVPLVTRCPEVEQDERREHVERDVQISHVGVDAGKDQRLGDAADG